MYVQTILDVHKKYNALVMSAFNNDAGFVAALDKVILYVSVNALIVTYIASTCMADPEIFFDCNNLKKTMLSLNNL